MGFCFKESVLLLDLSTAEKLICISEVPITFFLNLHKVQETFCAESPVCMLFSAPVLITDSAFIYSLVAKWNRT